MTAAVVLRGVARHKRPSRKSETRRGPTQRNRPVTREPSPPKVPQQ